MHTDTNLKAHVQPKHNASIPGTACTWYIILEFLWSCSAGKTGSIPLITTQHTNTQS